MPRSPYQPESVELIRARRLKDKIERYWGERGHLIAVRVEETLLRRCAASMPHFDYVVRSNLVNGLPAAAIAAGATL